MVLLIFTVVIPFVILKVLEYREKKKNEASRPSLEKTSFKAVQKMRHTLQMIEDRLGDAFKNKVNEKGEIVGFSSDKLFDAIDESGDGLISYEELDKAMALTGDQLAIFIQKMNEAAGYPDNTTMVSREIFVKYFFQTIDTASNFDPTPEDAGYIFDSIEDSEDGRVILDAEHLYKSSLSTFLSDKQILRLLRLFQDHSSNEYQGENLPQAHEDPEAMAGQEPTPPPLRKSVKNTPQAMGNQRKMGFSIHQQYITKETFVQLYPILLHNLVEKAEEEKCHMFDIQFEKLSLTVNVKGQEKAVVNSVTGRIQSGTMTALMGECDGIYANKSLFMISYLCRLYCCLRTNNKSDNETYAYL